MPTLSELLGKLPSHGSQLKLAPGNHAAIRQGEANARFVEPSLPRSAPWVRVHPWCYWMLPPQSARARSFLRSRTARRLRSATSGR